VSDYETRALPLSYAGAVISQRRSASKVCAGSAALLPCARCHRARTLDPVQLIANSPMASYRLRVLVVSAWASALACRTRPEPAQNLAGRTISSRSEGPAAKPCPSDTLGGVELSRHCVGPIPVDSSLGFVKTHFPTFTVDTEFLETTPVLVWHFHLGGDTAMASQQSDAIALSSPAFEWRVWGEHTLLPGRVPLPDTWGKFREIYPGDAFLTIGELGAQGEVCALGGPRLQLEYDYTRSESGRVTATSIPEYARIVQVIVYPSDAGAQCH
jgi:hypothetical protein